MKIGLKIVSLVIIAVIGFVIVAFLSLSYMKEIDTDFSYIGNVPTKAVMHTTVVVEALNKHSRHTAMLCFDSSDVENRLEDLNVQVEILYKNLDTLSSIIDLAKEYNAKVGEALLVLYNDLVENVSLLQEHSTLYIEAYKAGDIKTVREIRTGTYMLSSRKSLAISNEILDAAANRIYIAAIDSTETVDAATVIILACIGAILILLITISVIVIRGITKPLHHAVESLNKMSIGKFNDLNLTTTSKDETGMLLSSMENMVNTFNQMDNDLLSITEQVIGGNLKCRADATKHRGHYKGIMKEVNNLIDAFVEPIEVTANFLDMVCRGDSNIKKIDKEYKGEFNIIKNNINSVVDTLMLILGEMAKVKRAVNEGNLDQRANTVGIRGTWVDIMSGINDVTETTSGIIKESNDVLSLMAKGDLTPRIIGDYKGKFAEMKEDINMMGDSLTDLISQLQEAIHTTASASAEISSTADTLAAATQEQSSQTDEVATAMEEMSRTVTDNAHSATQTANVARSSGEVATTGGKVVEQTISKMKEIAAVVKMSADNIAKLGESSKKIGNIISVIDDIADQTNLLSLNAAIEAARAGEQGRGFAVVADSVGKLAISTASATKEIADMIKGIQVDTEAAVKAMEKGTIEVQSGIELADNAGKSIEDILKGINELLDMVNQIAAASEQQSATSEQISKNVSSISKVTADSARNVEDVASTANELARMTEMLTSLVSQFKIQGSSSHRSLGSNESRLLN